MLTLALSMNALPFESISKLLLFLHLGAAVVALASSIHLLSRLTRALRGQFVAQSNLHARILTVSYTATMLLGGLVYPTFRVRVRHDYLDATLPWATGLFEVKELWAALALLPAVIVWLLLRTIDIRSREHRPCAYVCIGLTVYVLMVLSFNAWAGWYLGTLKSV